MIDQYLDVVLVASFSFDPRCAHGIERRRLGIRTYSPSLDQEQLE
jgi:hypothetical protein